MTKKIFAMFLAVLMVVSMLPTSVFAAEATCPGKGSNKHTLENCTATAVETTAPTCGTKGFTTYTCDACGDMFVSNWVAATGNHSFVAGEAKAPTCAKPGYEAGVKCEVCGLEITGATIPALGNDKTNECEWVNVTPHINCETGGFLKFECAACGDTYEKEIKAKDHTWDVANPIVKDGKASVKCSDCGEIKDVDLIDGHEHLWIERKEVKPTCTTEGSEYHRVCRACGQLQAMRPDYSGNLVWTNVESVATAAAHWFECPAYCTKKAEHAAEGHVVTCVDSILHCVKCDQYVPATAEHVFSEWNTPADGKPTCSKPGYEKSTCSVCGIAIATNRLPALNHLEVTVNVPATCYTYAYSYTVCLRDDCDRHYTFNYPQNVDPSDYPMVIGKYEPIAMDEATILNGGFYLASNQKTAGYATYFNGTLVDNYYLGVTHDVTKAVKVYVEIVHPLLDNAYRLFFFNNEGVKTYIEIYENVNNGKLYGNVRLTTTKPDTYYNLDAAKGVLTASFVQKDGSVNTWFLNNYNKNTRIGASLVKYWPKNASSTTYPAYFCDTTAVTTFNIINAKFEVAAGFAANVHPNKVTTTNLPATCTEAGEAYWYCPDCALDGTEVIPAAHSWAEYAPGQKTSDGKEAVKYTICDGGYIYKYCTVSGCGAETMVTVPAWGHWWGNLIKMTPDHKNTVVYDHYECLCGEVKNVERKVWTNASTRFENVDAALKAHKNADGTDTTFTLVYYNPVRVNCATKMYDTYRCDDCGKAVYIKVAGTGEHSKPTDYVAPGCDKTFPNEGKGGYSTYKCTGCGVIIGDAALGEWNVIAPTGHNWVDTEGYEQPKCGEPKYYNELKHCANPGCTAKQYDAAGTGPLHIEVVGSYVDLCFKGTFEYYNCPCGKEHIINYVPAQGHTYVELDRYMKNADGTFQKDGNGNLIVNAANYKPATCTSAGWVMKACVYCGTTKTETIAALAHVNAKGEEFYAKCTDTVTDRHCVNCCECGNAGNAHDCTATVDKNGNKINPCDCVIGKPCDYYINTKMPSTCLEDAYTMLICRNDKSHQKAEQWADSQWTGHKPTSNYEEYIRVENADGTFTVEYAPGYYFLKEYTYELVPYYEVIINANGDFENVGGMVLAKLEKGGYVAPTYHADGSWTGVCAICGEKVTQKIAKLSGLGFELNSNLTESTFGSLIEVVVSANAANEGIYGFDFDVNFSAGMEFVGVKDKNNSFNFAVTAPLNVKNNTVEIVAYAVNGADGKRQNITITENTELVTLLFRSTSKAAAGLTVEFDNNTAVATKLVNNKVQNFECSYYKEVIKNREFLNFNDDAAFGIVDLYQAMSMITGEHPTGKIYDVTIDLNKDGEVTLEEITLAYEYYVGNCTEWDLFFMGIDETESKLLVELLTGDAAEEYQCKNPYCTYDDDKSFDVCPACKTEQ